MTLRTTIDLSVALTSSQGFAINGAVAGDERQVEPEDRVQHRTCGADHPLGELHHRRDQRDEHDQAQELELERCEHPVFYPMGKSRRQAEDTRSGKTQRGRGRIAIAHAEKWAQPEELDQDEIVDQRGADEDETEIAHVRASRQRTTMPGSAPLSGDSRKMSRPPGPAARTMPSEVPKRILRGARLATTTVRRPTSAVGS